MSRTGRLLFPALRWHPDSGFDHERDVIAAALGIGVGGFCIFGGDADGVRELTSSLHARSRVPLLIASDLERGAGQQFPQATPLPPLAAIGALDEHEVTRRAGALTAREALALGINWVYAPVADVDLEPRNPIVGSRSFGTDPAHVAAHVSAWIAGAHEEGVLCCAKHFPGHGRTIDDSHAALPHVSASRAELEQDLTPFRAAIAAGVDSIMTAHVVYDALDPTTAATLSRTVLTDLLRRDLGFTGLIVSDAVIMEGMLRAAHGDETRASITALNAGCDALLYPSDVVALASRLDAALGSELNADRAADAIARIARLSAQQQRSNGGVWHNADDAAWAADIALRSCTVARGTPRLADTIELMTIDDDVGGPYAPPVRTTFARTLRGGGIAVTEVEQPAGQAAACIAVYADIRAWKGAPGLSERAADALRAALDVRPDAVIVFFGHARLTPALPGAHILVAWGGEPIMQRAAATRLARAR